MSACDVQLIGWGKQCGTEPARKYTAFCRCGDSLTGLICERCTRSRLPGCLICWRNGAGHRCDVEFDSAECLCGCEEPVRIAERNQARYRMVKGRPMGWVPGHNSRREAEAS